VPVILFGLTVPAFAPAQQAYISDRVIYQKRGRALAAIEFAWSVTAIVVLPMAGWLIDAYGWRFPLFILSAGSFIGALLVWFYLPPAERHVTHVNLSWSEIRQLSLRPNVIACILVAMLTLITATSFISVWGIWLAKDFGLTAAILGLIATSIGVAELSGAGFSSLFIDRLGKRRGSIGGFILTILLFLSLPLSQGNLALAIALLTVMGLVLEFSIVSLLPLYAEQVPTARGTLFSLVLFGTAIGAAVGSPLTAVLWERLGLWGVCGAAVICILTAIGLIVKFIKD
jgi:predicted MFS family arabinose efflux permease